MSRIVLAVTLFFSLVLSSATFSDEGESLKSDSKETWGWRAAMITSLMLTLGTNPLGADESSVSFMQNSDVAGLKVGFRWHEDEPIARLMGADLTHYYLLAYNYWQHLDIDGQEGVNNVVEFIPVFRFNYSRTSIISFIETSVGVSVFSRTNLGDKTFSTNFQFANSLAFGGHFDQHASWSLQLQHYSNNSIKLPNNGINFYNLNFAHRF